jgi:hypothetical protein
MPNRPTPNIRLADLIHLDCRHHPAENIALLQRILDRQRVNHRRQHAHVVRRNAVHLLGLFRNAAEEIPPAHHDGRFHPQLVNISQFPGNFVDANRIDAEAFTRCQSLAGEL